MKLPHVHPVPAIIVGFAVLITIMVTVKSCTDPPPIPTTIVDTADAAAWRARYAARDKELAEARAEGSGLRARLQRAENSLRGIEVRSPVREVVFDTVIQIQRDTVVRTVTIEGGRAQIEILRPDSGGHRPVLLEKIDVRDCDDRLSIIGGNVICNRPTFGHVSVFVSGGAASKVAAPAVIFPQGSAGIEWRPTFRSERRITLEGTTDGQLRASARIGLRIF